MKKILLAALAALLLTSCGVGSYSVSSGKADEAYISFVSAKALPIIVTIDDNSFGMESVKDKLYKTDRKIKQTSENTLILTPGQHNVKVESNGDVLYSKTLFISTAEHKIVQL